MTKNILIKNAVVITNHNDRVIEDGFVLTDGNLVKEVGQMKSCHISYDLDIVDANGRVVMPGLINPHMHLYSAFARGMNIPRTKSFREILEKLWWKMDKALTEEDVYYSALGGLIEALKNGVTTIIDHHASYSFIRGSLDVIARAFSEVGLRGSLCFEVSDRWGKKKRDEAFEENISNRGMLGLHAGFTLSDESLKLAARIMDKYDMGAHIHLAEGVEDKGSVRRLLNAGILREGTLAVHCVHVDERETNLIKRSKATIVHCPISNLNNAVGISPYLKFCKKKIPTLIGTDGISSGMATDVTLASLFHKADVSNSVMNLAPKFASNLFNVELGVLKKGAAADVVIYDYRPMTSLNSKNYWSHIMFGIFSSRVKIVIVNGKTRLRDFELFGIDESEISKRSIRLANKFWDRSAFRTF